MTVKNQPVVFANERELIVSPRGLLGPDVGHTVDRFRPSAVYLALFPA